MILDVVLGMRIRGCYTNFMSAFCSSFLFSLCPIDTTYTDIVRTLWSTAALSATAYPSILSLGSFKHEASGAQIIHSISGHNSKCQPVVYFQVSTPNPLDPDEPDR